MLSEENSNNDLLEDFLKLSKISKNFNKELKKVKQEKESLIIKLSKSHALIDSSKFKNTMLFNIIDTLENKLKESKDLLEKFSSNNLKGMLSIHTDISNKPDLIIDDLSASTLQASTSPASDSELDSVSILALFFVWTKSLMCNDAVNRDSTFGVMSEDSACESEEFQVPCQPFGRCVIPFRRPSVYCSIRTEDVSFRPDIRQTSIICPDDVLLPSGHLHRIEKLLCQRTPSGHFSSTSRRLSVLERFTDSFQVSRNGRSINCPDDVVSRPDAYLRKARIAV